MDFKLLRQCILEQIRDGAEEVTEDMIKVILTQSEKRIRWRIKLPGAPTIEIKISREEPNTPTRVLNPGGPPKGPYR